jgi:hypothetical protein
MAAQKTQKAQKFEPRMNPDGMGDEPEEKANRSSSLISADKRELAVEIFLCLYRS